MRYYNDPYEVFFTELAQLHQDYEAGKITPEEYEEYLFSLEGDLYRDTLDDPEECY